MSSEEDDTMMSGKDKENDDGKVAMLIVAW